jgi:hypothetical protein
MYSFPSISQTWDPAPLLKNIGLPPIDLKALTGELTPPGNRLFATANAASDFILDLILFARH